MSVVRGNADRRSRIASHGCKVSMNRSDTPLTRLRQCGKNDAKLPDPRVKTRGLRHKIFATSMPRECVSLT